MDPILSVQNLTTYFEIEKKRCKVVDTLSFDLHPGKTLALVGESGCGKSMTALSILRILPTPPAVGSEGHIFYKGENLLSFSENQMRKIRGAKIAMIFQDPISALNPVFTIGSQLREVTKFHLGLEGKTGDARIFKALEEVSLPQPEQRMKEYPHQLSGGMLQRVMIAMALILEPEILIADEPTTALDMTIQAQILHLLKEIQRKRGMALLLITHDMGVVAEIADEVIVMYTAQPIERGSVEEIFDNPAHPYTQGLFQSRPNRPLQDGKLPMIKGTVPSLVNYPSGCSFHPRCSYCMPICLENEVAELPLPEKTHKTKCWLYDEHLEEKLSLYDIEAP